MFEKEEVLNKQIKVLEHSRSANQKVFKNEKEKIIRKINKVKLEMALHKNKQAQINQIYKKQQVEIPKKLG